MDENFGANISESFTDRDGATIPTNPIPAIVGYFHESRIEIAAHILDGHGGHDAMLKRIWDVVGDDLLHTYDAVNR